METELAFGLELRYEEDILHNDKQIIKDIEQFVQKDLCVAIVGAEIESNFSFIFRELCNLLPNCRLVLHMIGPNIKRKQDENYDNLKMKFEKKTLFHQIEDIDIQFDFIICFNSGFVAYRSWIKTIEKFMMMKIPVFTTERCYLTLSMFDKAKENRDVRLTNFSINPFRSVVKKSCQQYDLSWLSNSFICKLEF
ncbi:DgyrCDS11832 [Dimorphilus gyrociliatus]|uniref:DgyrCDS11832 n=1 Tax=Dimorphilus gyrociliatus TaxID=2664684 RepID=A0A7I8W4S7_9ANNE|nr:DgyrCDS11832 [Dimorphilus gyrociliatus]